MGPGAVLTVILTFALFAAPLAVDARQVGKVYRIGELTEGPAPSRKALMEAMRALGWVEGQDFTVESRSASSRDQLPALAAELVGLKVDLILTGGTPATRAAKEATKTIPIVFNLGDDPVGTGLVASFARPGGNLTGFTQGVYDEKLLKVLKQAVPGASRVAYPAPAQESGRRPARLNAAARVLGVKIRRVVVQGPKDFDSFFEAARDLGDDAVLVPNVAWFRPHLPRLDLVRARVRGTPFSNPEGARSSRPVLAHRTAPWARWRWRRRASPVFLPPTLSARSGPAVLSLSSPESGSGMCFEQPPTLCREDGKGQELDELPHFSRRGRRHISLRAPGGCASPEASWVLPLESGEEIIRPARGFSPSEFAGPAGPPSLTAVAVRSQFVDMTPVSESPDESRPLGGLTILVVEDHEDSREAMRQFLEYLGARVLLAGDGREGLAMVQSELPDLVLCDLRMPGVDGFEFMRRIRAGEVTSRLRVLAVSALGEQIDLNRTWIAGFDGHLVKPVDHELLLDTIGRVLWARFPTQDLNRPLVTKHAEALRRAQRQEMRQGPS